MLYQLEYKFIKVREQDHVFYLTLARAEKRNAFTPEMINEIHYAIHQANENPEVRLLILEAEGPVFCSGMDLNAFEQPDLYPSSSVFPKIDLSLGEVMAQLVKPSIAIVKGDVIAGGFLMILECTYVFANDDVQFLLPEVQIGLFPFQVLLGLLKHMPENHALDLCMRADVMTAQEMKDRGLVYELMNQRPELLPLLIQKLKDAAPLAVKLGIQASKALKHLPAVQQYSYLKDCLGELRTSEDFKEGRTARLEKRSPNWTGS